MKAIGCSLLLFVALAVVSPLAVDAQSSATEIDELKTEMSAQQKLLEKQKAHIEALEKRWQNSREYCWKSFTAVPTESGWSPRSILRLIRRLRPVVCRLRKT